MTATERDERVQLLLDRADIFDCLHRCARGMDRLDRALVRSAYHEGAIDDHVAFVGVVEDFIDWSFEQQRSNDRQHHFVTNQTIDVDGAVAHAESYYLFIGTGVDGDPLTVTGGRYVDRFEHRDWRWGIAARRCLVEWQTQLPATLSAAAFQFATLVGTIARDGADSSYERPLAVQRPVSDLATGG